MGLTVVRPAARGPKEGDDFALLSWRKWKVNTFLHLWIVFTPTFYQASMENNPPFLAQGLQLGPALGRWQDAAENGGAECSACKAGWGLQGVPLSGPLCSPVHE